MRDTLPRQRSPLFLLAALILLLTLLAPALSQIPVAWAAGDFYVNPLGNDFNTCRSPLLTAGSNGPCETIQGAIEKALADTDTSTAEVINVAAATYTEDIATREPDITIQATGTVANTIIEGQTGGNGATVTIDHGGVTLEGFTIEKETGNFENVTGIEVNADDFTLYNTLVNNHDTGIELAGGTGGSVIGGTTANEGNAIQNNGIGIAFASGAHEEHEVEGNTITDNTGLGISFTGATTGTIAATIFNNNISDNNSTDTQLEADNAVDVDASGNWWGTNWFVQGGTTPASPHVSGSGVDYTPWLGTSTNNATGLGFDGDFSTLYVDDLAAQIGTGTIIAEAIILLPIIDGGTVWVADGTYGAPGAIDRPVNLYGTQQGVSPNPSGTRGDEAIISGTTADPVISIDSPATVAVEIDGLSFSSLTTTPIQNNAAGAGVTIVNNIFDTVSASIDMASTAPNSVDFSNNYITSAPTGGLTLDVVGNPGATSVDITNNVWAATGGAAASLQDVAATVTGNALTIADTGINVFALSGTTSNSNISSNTFDITGNSVIAVDIGGTSNNTTLTGNAITMNGDATAGIVITPTGSANGVDISDNEVSVTGANSFGVSIIDNAINGTITGNTITATGTDATGLDMTGNTNGTQVTDNTFKDSDTGIIINPPAIGDPVVIQSNLFEDNNFALYANVGTYTGGRFNINYNAFVSSDFANAAVDNEVVYETGSTGSLDLTNNWWSCNEGPASTTDGVTIVGDDTTCPLVTDPSGGLARFDPWLTLRVLPAVNTTGPGGSVNLVASLRLNSLGLETGPPYIPDLDSATWPITFTETDGLGTLSPTSGAVVNGQSALTFTANTGVEGTTYVEASFTGETTVDPYRAEITIGNEPVITQNPTSVEIDSGTTTTLTVVATGATPLTYQWYEGPSGDTSNPVSGATSASFTTPALTTGTQYWVRVSNDLGTADSTAATVTISVPAGTPPSITQQPQGQIIDPGQTVNLSVVASGSTPLSYQWYEGASGDTSNPVAGATASTFTTPALTGSTQYWVRVTNSEGSADSDAATITLRSDVGENTIYLPLILTGTAQPSGTPQADIVVDSFTLSSNNVAAGEPVEITVVLRNAGTAPTEGFWVDLFVNPPSPLPTTSTRWDAECTLEPCLGIAWNIIDPIQPGDTVTLTSTSGSYASEQTRWEGWLANGTTSLYVLADSWNPADNQGGVIESDETNNGAQITGLDITGTNPELPPVPGLSPR